MYGSAEHVAYNVHRMGIAYLCHLRGRTLRIARKAGRSVDHDIFALAAGSVNEICLHVRVMQWLKYKSGGPGSL